MKKRFKLEITPAVEEFAKSKGAYFDKVENAWYVDGSVPVELEEFAQKLRPRQFCDEVTPQCVLCGCHMVLKSNRQNGEFWSCSRFPACKGAKPYDTATFVNISGLCTPNKELVGSTKLQPQKTIPPKVRERIERITTRAEIIFNTPEVAMRWFTTPKLSLKGKTPLVAMKDLDGCKKVEKLLSDCYK